MDPSKTGYVEYTAGTCLSEICYKLNNDELKYRFKYIGISRVSGSSM